VGSWNCPTEQPPGAELNSAAHFFVVFAFLFINKGAGLVSEPLQLRAPETVFVRFIATIAGNFVPLAGTVPYYIPFD
jgi:hypothetical protein